MGNVMDSKKKIVHKRNALVGTRSPKTLSVLLGHFCLWCVSYPLE